MITYKTCTRCKNSLSTDMFSKNKKASDGFQYQCKACQKEHRQNWDRRAYRDANRAHIQKKEKEYREKNREQWLGWNYKNRARKAELCAKRRAQLLKATIPLTTHQQAELSAAYHFARYITEETGCQHHVDHIIPLQGENICGLHVPWNLRVIPASENLSKGNRLIET